MECLGTPPPWAPLTERMAVVHVAASMSGPVPYASASTTHEQDELRRRLVVAVRHHCPDWLRADADDIVQTALVRLSAQDREMNRGYLDRVAYCAVIDELRRRRARRLVLVEVLPEPPSAAPADDPARVLEGRQLGALIRDCLAAMVAARRRAVTLYLEGHAGAEIAALLETAPKNAENLVYRGLEALRACLSAKGVGP